MRFLNVFDKGSWRKHGRVLCIVFLGRRINEGQSSRQYNMFLRFSLPRQYSSLSHFYSFILTVSFLPQMTIYKNCFGHLKGTSSKCNKSWGQNLKKKTTEKAKKLNSIIFELLFSESANPRKIILNKMELLLVWY